MVLSGRTPFSEITCLRQLTPYRRNSHYSDLHFRLLYLILSNTCLILASCSASDFTYTTVLFRNVKQHDPVKPLSTTFTFLWKVAGAVYSPKGRLLYSQQPSFVSKDVFALSPSAISVWLYSITISLQEKCFDPSDLRFR